MQEGSLRDGVESETIEATGVNGAGVNRMTFIDANDVEREFGVMEDQLLKAIKLGWVRWEAGSREGPSKSALLVCREDIEENLSKIKGLST
jgi:hypothetical protein